MCIGSGQRGLGRGQSTVRIERIEIAAAPAAVQRARLIGHLGGLVACGLQRGSAVQLLRIGIERRFGLAQGVEHRAVEGGQRGTRAALATFDGTVLNALRETETALNAYAQELDRRAALQAARDQAAEVADQARALYRGGRSGYLDALDADRGLATAQAALAASDAQLADDQVTLFLALGGGWQP